MRSHLLTFALAAIVTILIGVGVRMEPYFAGDVRVTRALQALSPDPGWWATPISRIPTAPTKYYVMAIAMILAYVLGGWRGLSLAVGAIVLDQYGGEASKSIFARPRPSPDLVKVAVTARGFTFPSTTLTFACATFGVLAILAARGKRVPMRTPVIVVAAAMIGLSCAARVVLGAHWPSDVLLTTVICMTWLWAAVRVVRL
jgi:membrane-associated phospholipid phosphatase